MIIAGTGHRPNKLGGYSQAAFTRMLNAAEYGIEQLNPTLIISGMALGWDQALATAGIKLRIPVRAFVPFMGQEHMWPQSSQDEYRFLLSKCLSVNYVCDPGYAAWKMQQRNVAMVNACNTVLALWDGTSGGTANCIAIAQRTKKPILNVYNYWKEQA